VLMHLAAALFHALVRHDGVFDAMAPGPRRESMRYRRAGLSRSVDPRTDVTSGHGG
jgi:hypothetical protein